MNIWDWLVIILGLISIGRMFKSIYYMLTDGYKDDADIKYSIYYALYAGVIIFFICRLILKYQCPECSFECPDWALQI